LNHPNIAQIYGLEGGQGYTQTASCPLRCRLHRLQPQKWRLALARRTR
jgi:hypothetical protein